MPLIVSLYCFKSDQNSLVIHRTWINKPLSFLKPSFFWAHSRTSSFRPPGAPEKRRALLLWWHCPAHFEDVGFCPGKCQHRLASWCDLTYSPTVQKGHEITLQTRISWKLGYEYIKQQFQPSYSLRHLTSVFKALTMLKHCAGCLVYSCTH